MTGDVAGDYSRTGVAWQVGPGRVYDVLAERLVADAPVDWSGRLVLDVGAGTGAASRAVARAGGRPIALDVASGMLAAASPRPPSLVSDARRLPVRAGRADGYVAAFCLNHLADPDTALAEARRVVRAGGPIVASAYAADDDHPVKQAVEAAAGELGWTAPEWVLALKQTAAPLLATVEGALAVAARSGLSGAVAEHVEVAFPELGPDELVAWRLGMAQLAPFVASLTTAQRAAMSARAVALLGAAPPLVRRIIVLRGHA